MPRLFPLSKFDVHSAIYSQKQRRQIVGENKNKNER